MKDEAQFSDVLKASRHDLDEILGWLKIEYEDDEGQGFWANRHIIENSHIQRDDLWVIRFGKKAVAFQVGDYGADIVSIRREFRGRGLGKKLFEAAVDRAIESNVNVLAVECEPKSSLGFWLKMGLQPFHDRWRPTSVMARKVLARKVELAPGLPRCRVLVSFFPEEAGYFDDDTVVKPISVYAASGALTPQGTVLLGRRILELEDREPRGKDLVVRIEVNGNRLCFEKAKYDSAEALGMTRDRQGGCFYIDEIRLGSDALAQLQESSSVSA